MGPQNPILITKAPTLNPYNSPSLKDPFKMNPILIIKAPIMRWTCQTAVLLTASNGRVLQSSPSGCCTSIIAALGLVV